MTINYKKAWADPIGRALILTKVFSLLSVVLLISSAYLLLTMNITYLIPNVVAVGIITTVAIFYKNNLNKLLKEEGKGHKV
jgi:multisubunit Na+/H+ antiporter MnhC subunit